MRYLAAESAGQSGPYLFGLASIAVELDRIAAGRTSGLGLLRRWLGQVDGRGGCAHPDGTVRLVRSALLVFGAELSEHAVGWCRDAGSVLPVPPGRPR
jgi:NADH:ubiquinone oxidoreductase subunit F (NADH-binding)